MKSRRKIVIIGASIIVLLLAITFTINRYYRHQLPVLPDFSNISVSLKNQILDANTKASRYPSAMNLGELGMVYNSSSNYDSADQCYQLAIKKNAKKWIWSYYLGYLRLEVGDSESAREYFGNVIKIKPDAFMAWYYTAESFLNTNEKDTAEKIFLKLDCLDDSLFIIRNTFRTIYFPLPLYAKFQLARIYMTTGRDSLAEKRLKEIIQKDITFGPAYRQLGNLYAAKNDSINAKHFSTRANDLTIYSPPADTIIDQLSAISRSHIFLLKQVDNAIRSANSRLAVNLLVQSIQYNIENKDFVSKIVKQLLSAGNGDQALQYAGLHFNYYKNDITEMLEVGKLLSDAGFRFMASRYFQAVESLTTEDAEKQSDLALLFYRNEMQEYSLSMMSGLIKKNPENVKILSDAAFLFLEANETEKYLLCISELKRLDSENPKIKILKGVFAEKEKDVNKAILFFEEAFKADPKNIYIIDRLSNIYLREKMWDNAINFIKRALVYYPNSSSLQEKLGGLLVSCPVPQLRNLNEGKELCERAFINYNYTLSTKISAGRNLSIAYSELGNPNLAYFYINKTIEIARQTGISKDYLENLVNLSHQFSVQN